MACAAGVWGEDLGLLSGPISRSSPTAGPCWALHGVAAGTALLAGFPRPRTLSLPERPQGLPGDRAREGCPTPHAPRPTAQPTQHLKLRFGKRVAGTTRASSRPAPAPSLLLSRAQPEAGLAGGFCPGAGRGC